MNVLPVEFCRDVQSEASFKNLKIRGKKINTYLKHLKKETLNRHFFLNEFLGFSYIKFSMSHVFSRLNAKIMNKF